MRIDPEYVEDPALLRSEIRRLQAVIAASEPTLTDAEREAVEFVAGWLEDGAIPDTINHSRYAAIRGMLERLGCAE